MTLNEIMLPAFVGVCGVYIAAVSLLIGRVWAERGFRAEREKYRKDREAFEAERDAARRLLADLKRNQRGLHENPIHRLIREIEGRSVRTGSNQHAGIPRHH